MVFLTLPGYSFIALASAVEALRMANRVTNRQHYDWAVASLDGSTLPASNGFSVAPTIAIDSIADPGIVFVWGEVDIEKATTRALLVKLRELAARQVSLGSLCTGGYALAMAGLLNRYEAVVHWEQLHLMLEIVGRHLGSDVVEKTPNSTSCRTFAGIMSVNISH